MRKLIDRYGFSRVLLAVLLAWMAVLFFVLLAGILSAYYTA